MEQILIVAFILVAVIVTQFIRYKRNNGYQFRRPTHEDYKESGEDVMSEEEFRDGTFISLYAGGEDLTGEYWGKDPDDAVKILKDLNKLSSKY